MKRRTKAIALASSLLIGVSMIGVGFATWVISNDTDATVSGTVAVEEVIDHALRTSDFSITLIDGKAPQKEDEKYTAPVIHYGALESQTGAAYGWFNNNQLGTENLTFTITFSVSNVVGEIRIDFETSGGDWARAIELGYVKAPAYSLAANSNFELSGSTISQTETFTGENQLLTLTVTFAWGDAFGGMNPYTFYNQYDIGMPMSTYGSAWQAGGAFEASANTTNDAYSVAKGNDMFELLNGVNYEFSFTASRIDD